MDKPRVRRLALLGALCGVALGLLHAAGWGAFLATLPNPHDDPGPHVFAWRLVEPLAVVGVFAGGTIGALVGAVTARRRDLPPCLLAAAATGLLVILGLVGLVAEGLVAEGMGGMILLFMVPGLALTAAATYLFVRRARRRQGASGPGTQPEVPNRSAPRSRALHR